MEERRGRRGQGDGWRGERREDSFESTLDQHADNSSVRIYTGSHHSRLSRLKLVDNS